MVLICSGKIGIGLRCVRQSFRQVVADQVQLLALPQNQLRRFLHHFMDIGQIFRDFVQGISSFSLKTSLHLKVKPFLEPSFFLPLPSFIVALPTSTPFYDPLDPFPLVLKLSFDNIQFLSVLRTQIRLLIFRYMVLYLSDLILFLLVQQKSLRVLTLTNTRYYDFTVPFKQFNLCQQILQRNPSQLHTHQKSKKIYQSSHTKIIHRVYESAHTQNV